MKVKIHQNHLITSIELKNKLETFIELTNKDINYIKDISGYLRNIYCYKSGTKSFLSRIIEKNNIDISVNIILSTKEKKKFGYLNEDFPEPIYEQLNSAIIWFDDNDDEIYNRKKISILDAIKKENELFLGGNYYSYKKFIEIISDKFNAHLDESIHLIDLNILGNGIEIGGMNPAYRGIYDLAKITVILLDKIILFLNDGTENNFIKIKNKGKQ